jgi:hypothetical protein
LEQKEVMMINANHKLVPTLFFLLVLLVIAVPVTAQEPVTATLDPVAETDSYTVGDPILLQLTVQHPPGTHLIVPDLPEEWGNFTLVSVGVPDTTTAADGHKTTTITLDTRLFAPGEFQTPPLTLQLADTTGRLTEFEIPAVPINVQSVLVEGDSALRDIKPPVDLPAGSTLLLFLGGLTLGIVGAGVAYWYWRNGRIMPVPVDNRPATIIALDELDQLEQQQLPAQGKFKPYYTALSHTLRRFLGREYGIAVEERTTMELSYALQQRPHPAAELRRQFVHLLHECDLVKFADAPSSPAQAAAILADMRAAIQSAQPAMALEEPGRSAVSQPAIQLHPAQMEVRS